MVSTRKKKHQNKRLLSQLIETSNCFIIGNDINADTIEIETLEPQTSGLVNNFVWSIVGENSASHDEVIQRNFADNFRKEVVNAVMAVESRVPDEISTAMYNVVIPIAELAVRSVIESSGRGPNSMAQNPDQRDFSGNTENTPLMSALSRVDLNNDQDRNNKTRNVENFEDGDFPVLRPNHDRQAHTHRSYLQFFICSLQEF